MRISGGRHEDIRKETEGYQIGDWWILGRKEEVNRWETHKDIRLETGEYKIGATRYLEDIR